MGNAEYYVKTKETNNVKKDYFLHVTHKIYQNIKDIEFSFGLNGLCTINFLGERNNSSNWKTYICNNLEIFKLNNGKDVSYVDNVKRFIENLDDSYSLIMIHKLKTHLANDFEHIFSLNNNLTFEQNQIKKLKNKKIIIKRAIHYILDNINCYSHPINKVIQILIFNFSKKYQEEIQFIQNMILEDSHYDILKAINNSNKQIEGKKHPNCHEKIFKEFDITKSYEISLSSNEINHFYDYAKDEMIKLSRILRESIIKFYNILEDLSVEYSEEIEEKVIDLLIQGELLLFFQRLKYKSNKKLLNIIKQKMWEFQYILPKDLGLNSYYSLDLEFKSYTMKFLKENKKFESNLSDKDTKPTPFLKSLMYFSEIGKAYSLTAKLNIICNLRNIIIEEIDLFWKDIQVKQICLDADNFISIFIYLIIKNQSTDLKIDLDIINDFMNKTLTTSSEGKI